MKNLASFLTILLLASSAASGSPTNLLIGKWNLDPATKPSSYCLAPLEFTPTSFTQRDLQGKLSTIPVSYIPGGTSTFPTVVYLLTGGDHLTYGFSSKDRMVLDTWLQCTYIRA